MVYLDYAAHCFADPLVLEELCKTEQDYISNPKSNHSSGHNAKHKLDDITEAIAKMLQAEPNEVLFTSSATEANRLAISNLKNLKNRHIISTCLEHFSVHSPLSHLKDKNYEIDLADILPTGTVDLEHIKELITEDTVLITLPWVDSELGAIQPIKEVADILKDYPNCSLHVDAAQAAGKIPVTFEKDCITNKISTLSISPHKFHGVCGSGLLLKRQHILQQHSGGTPALSLAAATYKALELSINNMEQRYKKVALLRQKVVQALSEYSKVRINSPLDGSPYILNISVQGVKGTDFQEYLNKSDIYVSVKSACSVVGTMSRPVFAVSRNKKNALSSFRISFSHYTTAKEIDMFLEAFDTIYKRLERGQKI